MIRILLLIFLSFSISLSSQDGVEGKRRYKSREHRNYGKKAEKGKKKERDKTKPERKLLKFRRKRSGEKDADQQSQGLFHKNERKRKKEIRKKARNPQGGLWPSGKPGKQP